MCKSIFSSALFIFRGGDVDTLTMDLSTLYAPSFREGDLETQGKLIMPPFYLGSKN